MRAWNIGVGLLTLPAIRAFTFSHTSGSQCQQITLQWEGGEPPYYATVVPAAGAPGARIQNISIPTGPTHSFRLDQAAGVEYSIVMSDATGFGAGGVTPLLRSGTSGDTSCIGPMVGFDFYFYLTPPGETTQPQCTPLSITWDMSITYPLQLLAVVPGSAAFSIPVPQTPDENSITWDLAVREGAQYQLLMANAGLYGTGGATNLTRVTAGSAGCLTEGSPGPGTAQATVVTSITAVPSTSASASASGSLSWSRSSTSTMRSESTGSSGSSGPDAGAIAGGVVGGILGLALLILLALCYRRKKRQQAYRATEITKPMRQVSTHRSRSSFDILGRTGASSPPLPPPPVDQEDPFVSPYPAGRGSGSTTGLAGMAEMGQQYGSVRAPSSDDLPPLAPGMETREAGAAAAGVGAGAGAGALGMHGLPSRVQSHQRISSMDTSTTRPSRKVSGTFNETAPPTPTVRHSFADAMSAGTAGTAGHPSPSRTPQRLSRARWSVDELGQVPDVPDMQEGEEGRRVIQHQDSDVLELPPSYNQLRARNPDERSV